MSPKGSITATHLWKRFHADYRRRLLRDQLQTIPARLRGHGRRGWRWALRDVNLVAEPGESIGLVGSNGSGKTTLLKILTGVMHPHTGRVEALGRIGALIEVRAGIHPDLTGRENIQLYGTLLGFGRRQIRERFDEIVDFAGVEHAIERQVKHYSMGMQMRLGFAVAAFLQPDILLVDEVLAVGDASFQQRCLERIQTTLAEGTTLVFVSHDLPAVEATCKRGIWLQQGVLRADGPVREVVGAYRDSIEAAAESAAQVHGEMRLVKLEVGRRGAPQTQAPLDVDMVFDSPQPLSGRLFIGISEGPATPIFTVRRDLVFPVGELYVHCQLERLPLPRGRFWLWMGVQEGVYATRQSLPWQPVARFDVSGPAPEDGPPGVVSLAPVQVESHWQVERR
jgi:ABC-type polysaccharide/polyol phosphate transport system ATPase subunit